MTNRERPEIITRSYGRRLVYADFGKPQAGPVLYFHGACSHIGLYSGNRDEININKNGNRGVE